MKRRIFAPLFTLLFLMPLFSCVEEEVIHHPCTIPLEVSPPLRTYLPEQKPLVEMSPEFTSSLSPPLLQVGEDEGDPGFLYAGALAGYYILRIQLPDGSFSYHYDPLKNKWSDKNSTARQIGATYSVSFLYEMTGREEFRQAALWSHARIARKSDTFRNRLGASTKLWSLALLIHSRVEGNTDWSDEIDVGATINELGEFFLSEQAEDGSYPGQDLHGLGQILQGLWYFYMHAQDERFLDALEKGARYAYDTEFHEYDMLYTLWGNEPVMQLYRLRPADWMLDLVFSTTEPIVEAQIQKEGETCFHGGFILGGQTVPGAYSQYGTELVLDAYRLAEIAGDTERMDRYRNSALKGARFMKELQFRKGDTDHYSQPEMMVGGIPFGLDRPQLRVDTSRHMINTMIKLVTYLDLEEYPLRGSEENPWLKSWDQ